MLQPLSTWSYIMQACMHAPLASLAILALAGRAFFIIRLMFAIGRYLSCSRTLAPSSNSAIAPSALHLGLPLHLAHRHDDGCCCCSWCGFVGSRTMPMPIELCNCQLFRANAKLVSVGD